MMDTALLVALPRAAESHRLAQGRVFGDPWSSRLLPAPLRQLLGVPGAGHLVEATADRLFPGSFTSLLLRNRFFDSQFAEAVLQRGVQQVVVLGAGLDSIALRHRGLCQSGPCRIFEVDLPGPQARKQALVERAWGERPAWLDFVSHDLREPGLGHALEGAGLARGIPTLILAEGVLPYLEAGQVERVLRDLRALLGPGDQIVASLVPPDMPGGQGESEGGRRVSRLVKGLRSPLRWGCDRAGIEHLASALAFDLGRLVDVREDLVPLYLYGALLERPVAATTSIACLVVPGQAPEVRRGFRRRR